MSGDWESPKDIASLDKAHDQALRYLGSQPSNAQFEEEYGMELVELLSHAQAALDQFMNEFIQGQISELQDPDNWIALYTAGIVTGINYNRNKSTEENST